MISERALEHAAGLRAAADAGYGPADALVTEGVADAFERAVAELDASMQNLLNDAPGQEQPH